MAGTTAIKKFVNYFWGESDTEPEPEPTETITNEVYGYEEEPETMGGIEGINPFKRKSKILWKQITDESAVIVYNEIAVQITDLC